jgi:tetraacyldisaccharide 4'-kinase
MSAGARLQGLWYGPAWRGILLWPLAWMFGIGVGLRRGMYSVGLLRRIRIQVPVLVVGNLTVGGAGKTPVAAWLARQLTRRGHRVGVVLRGYGGRHSGRVRVVAAGDDPVEVGDEALLHARNHPHVVVIGADRVAAARLAEAQGSEVVVCDDGLQHLRLARDYEIVVVDAARGFGNGWLLPAGPLREPARRVERADAVVLTRRGHEEGSRVRPRRPFVVDARLSVGTAVNLRSGERRGLGDFRGSPVHAVAALGNPQAFFDALRGEGLDVVPHPLPDHAPIRPGAPLLPDEATVLMTEKDAVKCTGYARAGWWYVELDVGIERGTAQELLDLVLERAGLTGAGVKLG